MASLVADFWRIAGESPDRPAVRSGQQVLTYGELRKHVAHRAGHLLDVGVREGDRAVLVAPSVPEFVVDYYALQAVGAVVITVNVMSTVPEIGYVLEDSGTSLVLAWHECADAARSAAATADIPFFVIEPFEDAGESSKAVRSPVDRDENAVAVILYTSGTTGRPKGAALTVANINSCVPSFRTVLALGPDERWATALPLFHVFGQGVVMNTSLSTGASLTLQHPFSPGAFMDLLRDERITIACGVPTMWNAMLQAAGDHRPADFAELRLASSGGASMPGELIRAFQHRFGCCILEGYGLTESTGAATYRGPDDPVGTVGKAVPGMMVEVRDPDGRPVATGDVGEVFVKGPGVMKGYWNRPEATAAELVDGWLRTGDLGSLDEEGMLRIVDRAKDLIIRGGYNVYPREVEEVLYAHPDIVEVAVVGVPDDHYGEEIAAVITPRPGATIRSDELRDWAKDRLSAYKVPRIVHCVEELPKGATGKILKRAIDRDVLRIRSMVE
ncbi:AMP-binding protein [Gordonia sp. CPCC 206044]|uniref:AMP-binding protein n=1 Tax=Gordonia sp. CPCC 206044 TaxID=3140793 RepID=UPI003AF3AC4F